MAAKKKTVAELRAEKEKQLAEIDAQIAEAEKLEKKEWSDKSKKFVSEVKDFLGTDSDREAIIFIARAHRINVNELSADPDTSKEVTGRLTKEQTNAIITQFEAGAPNAEIALTVFGIKSLKAGDKLYSKLANLKSRWKAGKLTKKD